MDRSLTVLWTHSRSIGYGRAGTDLVEAFRGLDFEVHDWVEGWNVPSSEKVENPGLDETVMWLSVPVHVTGWYKGQRPVVLTMYESTRLPEQFRENMHEFDTVIVPSEQNLELFSQFHPNVRYVPLGVHSSWKPTPRRPVGPFFNFLTAGSGPRKGCELVAEAFKKAFPDPDSMDPIPRLIHKSPRGIEVDWVETVSGRLTDEAEIGLYEDAHCFVMLSRGEGFGFQPLQAIAQGIPTILTDAHGHKAFSHLGWPIRADLEPAGYFFYGDSGFWWEPRLPDVVDAMRDIYDNYESAKTVAWSYAKAARERFSWENTAKRILDVIGTDRLGPFTGEREWYETKRKKFWIRTTKPFQCEAAGVKYHFQPGIDYWDVADVKRMVYDAQILDPACQDDQGLELGIPTSSATHSYCGSCGQMLNTQPTKADEIYAQMLQERGLS